MFYRGFLLRGRLSVWLGWGLCLCGSSLAVAQAEQSAGTQLRERELQVAGISRRYWWHHPPQGERAVDSPALPVVLVFHGHGGNAQQVARSYRLHEHWPEAVVVYPQGIPTPGQLTDPEGRRNGWQARPGDQADRDLKFFDALLTDIAAHAVIDSRRVYATGHSNGGGFTYLLWSQRSAKLAAVAPSAAVGAGLRGSFTPKPLLHLAGTNDPLVKFEWQELMLRNLKRVNRCEPTGTAWGPLATHYASSEGTPIITYLHEGGHRFPSEAVPLIVRFFKEHALPEP